MDNTIRIISDDACTGCAACYNRCPVNAVSMEMNEEGFRFPEIDENKCISCGLCLSVCPEHEKEKISKLLREPLLCKAAMCRDEEIRMKSSSGGMFFTLGKYILDHGGAVCGAVYSDDYSRVLHLVSEDVQDLERMRGSKYVESEIANCYKEIEERIKINQTVLFSGCPCQVEGLRSFLQMDYENLYTADVVCHGANSLFAYQSYIRELARGREILSVNFRDKTIHGWSTPVTIKYKDGTMDDFPYHLSKWYDGFLNGIMNRKCCSNCHYAQKNRVGDITLGDFWQVHRWEESCNDWKGTSLVLINTEHGEILYDKIKDQLKLDKNAPFEAAAKYNGQLNRPTKMADGRRFFFQHLNNDGYHKSLWYGREWRYDFGLVGWWFAANYGSVLTYYALGKILLGMNRLPILIRISKKDGLPWEDITQKSIDFMAKHFYISKERSFEKTTEVNRFCDGFLLGSDQLWVNTYSSLIGHIFYLSFADENKKKIAYATSLGYEKFDAEEIERRTAAMLLRRFDAISVRESSGTKVCKNEFELEAVRMLDPVFLCDLQDYYALVKDSSIDLNLPYIFCYILDMTEEKRQFIHRIEFSMGMKAKILYDMKNEEQSIRKWDADGDLDVIHGASIEDFVALIKNGSFIITDSHHGACFGFIFEKQMIVIKNTRRGGTRFDSLFHLLEIEDCLLDEEEICEYDYVRDYKEISYEMVNRILCQEREKSLNWLKKKIVEKHDNAMTDYDVFSKYVWSNDCNGGLTVF